MPRTKGSKNKPKVVNDFASQIAEKQSTIESLNTEIASITANIDSLKAVHKSLGELHLHGVLAPPCRSFSFTLPH